MATFLEGVGSIGVACTLAALVPAVALVLVARKARLTVALSYLLGAALLTWARAAGHWNVELSGAAVFVAAALAAGAFVLAYRAKRAVSLSATGSGVVAGALAGWLWRPCVGPKLGEILNNADTEGARTLGLMLVYMAGALLPALLLAVLPHALPGAKRAARPTGRQAVPRPPARGSRGWRSGRRLRHHPGRRPLRRPNRRALPNSHQRLNGTAAAAGAASTSGGVHTWNITTPRLARWRTACSWPCDEACGIEANGLPFNWDRDLRHVWMAAWCPTREVILITT